MTGKTGESIKKRGDSHIDLFLNFPIMDMNRKFANNVLFPNLNKVMRAMRFMPGLWGKQRALESGKPEEIERRTVPFEEMIEEYYHLRDIDDKGRPSRRRLESLGMKDVADALF